VEAREAAVERWGSVHSASRHHLETVSLIVHPWHIVNSTPQTSQAVESRWHAAIDAIKAFMETHGLPAKQKALEKVRTQLAGVSALVDVWWQRVWQDGQQVALTPMWKRGVDEQLLPLMYGQHQGSRTRCPRRKAKLLQVLEAFKTPLTRTRSPSSWRPMCLRVGRRGRRSMPRPFSVPRRPSKAATALWRNSITISGAYRSGAPR
jgi:hypothetical protein